MSRALLRHNRIWTGDPSSPWTDALLVEDGRIISVGGDAHDGGAAEVIDLPGALVMPGLHDAHIHTEWVARDLAEVDLREARSLDEALGLIRDHVASLPRRPPAQLRPLEQQPVGGADPARPARVGLGDRRPGRGAGLRRRTHRLGELPCPATGAASLATARTRSAARSCGMRPVSRRASFVSRRSVCWTHSSRDRTLSRCVRSSNAAREWLLSVGLTSITDIDGEDARAAYLAMQEDGTLRLRVTKCVRDGDLELAVSEGRRSGQGDDRFRVGPVKFFSDGALGSHTAHMTEPYVGSMAGHETCGIAVTPYPVLLQRVRMSLEAGLDVITHAIGDEANRLVLDAFQVMREEGARRTAPHRARPARPTGRHPALPFPRRRCLDAAEPLHRRPRARR